MSTSYYPPSRYQPYLSTPPAARTVPYQSSGDPRKLAANQRTVTQETGDTLMGQDAALADQYRQQASGVEGYLDPIQSNLAEGGGGYSPDEAKQIQLSGQEKQNLITGAGISAGAGNAATVGAAERAAAAAGGSPAALATFRARAAQQQAGAAGDAMTNARSAAKQLESQGAQTVGNARMGQQGAALNYYGNLENSKTQAGLGEQGLQNSAFGTQTQGTTAATNAGITASQTPSTFDKVLGAAAGAAKFIADGEPGYLADGQEAVLGEDGPEAVVEQPRFMAGGGEIPGGGDLNDIGEIGDVPVLGDQNPQYGAPKQNWLQSYLAKSQSQPPAQQPQQPQQWTKATPYQQLGEAVGQVASHYLGDGTVSVPPKMITSPTRVKLAPGDAVVPLSFRATAKVRPSAAVNAYKAAGMPLRHVA